jgi:general secretion pathway protein F
MPSFRFRALDAAGARAAGVIEAPDAAAAVARLRAEGRLPLSVELARGGRLMAALNAEITPRATLSPADRAAFTRGLATLAAAGLPLDRALEIARDFSDGRAARGVAARLLAAVRGGAALADAMEAEKGAFPPVYRAVVRAGEASGGLGAALGRLADAEEAANRRRGALRSALVYPVFLVVSSVGAVAALLIFVAPTFEPMLAEAGATPPLSTRIVMGAGRAAAEGWPWALAALLVLAVAAALAMRHPSLRLAASRAALRLPAFGPLRRRLQTARLARLLGELLSGGVALPAALRLARTALTDAAFADALDRATPQIEAGRGLAGPLGESGALAPLAVQLIRVGEESGRLAPMLLRTADILDEEARQTLDRLLAMLTPTLTLVMGGVIALIVSSILFALFSINELAIGRP